jgi:hypothetical protein
MLKADELKELFGTGTRPLRKDTLEMEGAEMHLFCHFIKRRLFPEILPDIIDSRGYPRVIDVFLLVHIHRF